MTEYVPHPHFPGPVPAHGRNRLLSLRCPHGQRWHPRPGQPPLLPALLPRYAAAGDGHAMPSASHPFHRLCPGSGHYLFLLWWVVSPRQPVLSGAVSPDAPPPRPHQRPDLRHAVGHPQRALPHHLLHPYPAPALAHHPPAGTRVDPAAVGVAGRYGGGAGLSHRPAPALPPPHPGPRRPRHRPPDPVPLGGGPEGGGLPQPQIPAGDLPGGEDPPVHRPSAPLHPGGAAHPLLHPGGAVLGHSPRGHPPGPSGQLEQVFSPVLHRHLLV